MKTIWKYEIDAGYNLLKMPKGAEALTVQLQGWEPQLWAVVDPEAPLEDRIFSIYGTGHVVPSSHGKYVATYHQGPLVWHVFEGD